MDEPNFFKQKPQECVNHAMWDKHLRYAFWGLLIAGFLSTILFDNPGGSLTLIGLSVILFLVACALDAKHAMWHMRQNDDTNKK